MIVGHLLQHGQLHDALRQDVTRTDTAKGQALWQPGGAEEDSHFCEGDRHLHLEYSDEEEDPVTVY